MLGGLDSQEGIRAHIFAAVGKRIWRAFIEKSSQLLAKRKSPKFSSNDTISFSIEVSHTLHQEGVGSKVRKIIDSFIETKEDNKEKLHELQTLRGKVSATEVCEPLMFFCFCFFVCVFMYKFSHESLYMMHQCVYVLTDFQRLHASGFVRPFEELTEAGQQYRLKASLAFSFFHERLIFFLSLLTQCV